MDVTEYPGPIIPTVFTAGLQGAEGLFLANNLYMRHRDIIFVSDSPSVDLTKFLQVLQQITATAQGVTGLIRDIENLQSTQGIGVPGG